MLQSGKRHLELGNGKESLSVVNPALPLRARVRPGLSACRLLRRLEGYTEPGAALGPTVYLLAYSSAWEARGMNTSEKDKLCAVFHVRSWCRPREVMGVLTGIAVLRS